MLSFIITQNIAIIDSRLSYLVIALLLAVTNILNDLAVPCIRITFNSVITWPIAPHDDMNVIALEVFESHEIFTSL